MSEQVHQSDEVEQRAEQSAAATDVAQDAAPETAHDAAADTAPVTAPGAGPDAVAAQPESSDAPEDAQSDDQAGSGDDDARPTRRQRLEQEGEIAADYLEELLEIADLDGDLDMDVEGDRATVSIVGAELPQLVGDGGEVLEALQELTRLAVYRETGERSRLMLDVSGHRADRRTALEAQATEVIEQVRSQNERVSMDPMSPFERKVVHDVVAAAGLSSESEGAEPRRYVVVLPQ